MTAATQDRTNLAQTLVLQFDAFEEMLQQPFSITDHCKLVSGGQRDGWLDSGPELSFGVGRILSMAH